jgi:alginate O-acetyltransferase complex protein AlgJ
MPPRLLLSALVLIAIGLLASAARGDNHDAFRQELAAKVATLERRNAGATAGVDGWLFLTSELRFLAQGRFWGDAAAAVARVRKPQAADPLPAIVDFHRQKKERGIELVVVPVPPKAAIYPDKLGVATKVEPGVAAPLLEQFEGELRSRGVEVLDLSAAFAKERSAAAGPVYCQTDSHWSGLGCVWAGKAIAEHVRGKIATPVARKNYAAEMRTVTINGDLPALLPPDVAKPPPEKISVRAISEANGAAISADANSPVLILGDSHTLVFHEFLAEKAGLLDQLGYELGFAPDLIGTRGSGATAVRVSLYRKTRSDPAYLAKKKIVVWCFAAREFTEADQGWVVQPVAK